MAVRNRKQTKSANVQVSSSTDPTPQEPAPVEFGQTLPGKITGGCAAGVGLVLAIFTDSESIGEDSRWIALVLTLGLAALVAFSPFLAQFLAVWKAGKKEIRKRKRQVAAILILVVALFFGFGLMGPAGLLTVACFTTAFKCLFGKNVPLPPTPPSMTTAATAEHAAERRTAAAVATAVATR